MSDFNNPNFSLDLSDQIALVTGASSGLGYRFSKVLAKCGAKVALSARRVDKLEKLSEEITSDGGECMVVPIDMVDRDTIREAVQTIEEGLGTVNTLINNAGMVDAQWAIKQSDELIDNVVATNLVGPYLLSNEVARRLIEKVKDISIEEETEEDLSTLSSQLSDLCKENKIEDVSNNEEHLLTFGLFPNIALRFFKNLLKK